jgi:hypothetical protein
MWKGVSKLTPQYFSRGFAVVEKLCVSGEDRERGCANFTDSWARAKFDGDGGTACYIEVL